jgi:hypothetical protein
MYELNIRKQEFFGYITFSSFVIISTGQATADVIVLAAIGNGGQRKVDVFKNCSLSS